MYGVGALSDKPDTSAERALRMLAWIKNALTELPDTHESAIEIDKHEVLQRIDMVTMTAAAVHSHGPRPDLLFSVQKDALVALAAATDARSRAGWDLGKQVSSMLMVAASILSSMPAMLAVP